MRNDDDDVLTEYDADEARLFAGLPREAVVAPGEFDRLVGRLRAEGLVRERERRSRWGLVAAAAAAILFFVAGVAIGGFNARRNSLEDMLARSNLSVAERVLLLQRAGSAYVHAAQSYAEATANVDSAAVEVASRVLMGAAHAVARNGLDAGLSARLATALQPSGVVPVSEQHKPVIWY